MFGGMYSVATAVDGLEEHHRILSKNLSHINTPGYRRQVAGFKTLTRPDVAQDSSPLNFHGSRPTSIVTDHTAGAFQRTGRSLDFAIQGDGFFELTSPNGPRYTRSGVFYVSPDNTLVTAAGVPVAGETGEIFLPPNTTPDRIRVSAEGVIRVGDQEAGKLRIVAFEDNNELELEGAVTFKATKQAAPKEAAEFRVLQGSREQSNVSATHELIKLMTGVRHHDAIERMLRSMSDAMQQRTSSR